MAPIKLRVRASSGVTDLEIDTATTFAQLKARLDASSLRSGYPPKPLKANDSQPISDFLRNGDLLIVHTAAKTPQKPTRLESSPVHSSPPSSSILSQGTLNIREVPDDNSCLFRSVNSLLGRPQTSTAQLRTIVARFIAAQPDQYSEAMLGRSNLAYRQWILSDNAWGGAIELGILCHQFQIELAAYDVKTMRLDRYGEGNNYSKVAFLVYDGIHYNYIALAVGGSRSTNTDITQFDAKDQLVTSHVKALVQKQHDQKNYTDTAAFLLRCGQCGKRLKGEKEAMEHAESTGHTQFSEK